MITTCIKFDREAGVVSSVDSTGTETELDTEAYSGAPGYVNDPEAEPLRSLGPIPAGWWSIGMDTSEKGPLTLPLTPDPDTVTFGRFGFLIHGDNASKPPQSSSEGCLIANHAARVVCSQFTRLLVI